MGHIVFLQAAVDFVSELNLEDLAPLVARACFGGIPFVGAGEGLWDEVPAVRLEHDVLGMEAVLGGYPGRSGGYTLELASRDPVGGELPTDPNASRAAIAEFSAYLGGLLARVPG